MKNTRELLDAVRERHGLTSDYQLAKFFSVKQATVSNYRTGKSYPDERIAMLIAGALDIEPGYVLASVAAERTHNDQAREVWSALAKKLSPAAVATLLLIVSGSALLSGHEPGALLACVASAVPSPTLYIMLNGALLFALAGVVRKFLTANRPALALS